MLAAPPEMMAMINEQMGQPLRLFIGTAEVLAAVGLLLPGLTRIWPWLTALAAAGLMIVMASATGLHLVRGETESAITTAVLFVMVTFVAYMRWKVAPLPVRKQVLVSQQQV